MKKEVTHGEVTLLGSYYAVLGILVVYQVFSLQMWLSRTYEISNVAEAGLAVFPAIERAALAVSRFISYYETRNSD